MKGKKEVKKQKKPAKALPLCVICTLLGMISEVILVFVLFAAMEALVFNSRNMAGLDMMAAVGCAISLIYGLAEFIVRKRFLMKWYLFSAGIYFIPIAIWIVLSLTAYTSWYSHMQSENAEFFMYFTRTMLGYAAFACAFRMAGHILYRLFTAGFGRKNKNKRNKKDE